MTSKHQDCNHHHEMTDRHRMVTIGGDTFVANVKAIPLLEALNDIGLKTRTHHIADNCEHAFVSILLDNAHVEVRKVQEIHSTRDHHNGKYEVLIWWQRGRSTGLIPDQQARAEAVHEADLPVIATSDGYPFEMMGRDGE